MRGGALVGGADVTGTEVAGLDGLAGGFWGTAVEGAVGTVSGEGFTPDPEVEGTGDLVVGGPEGSTVGSAPGFGVGCA